jgi:hypothetical protein
MGVLVYVACPEASQTLWAADLLRQLGAHEAATMEVAEGAAAA